MFEEAEGYIDISQPIVIARNLSVGTTTSNTNVKQTKAGYRQTKVASVLYSYIQYGNSLAFLGFPMKILPNIYTCIY